MYALRRQEGLEDRPPRAQRPPLGSPVSWLFVLPRFARRPARFMRRLMRGDVAIPRHTGALAAAAFLAATGAYGALVGGHMPVVMGAMTSASGLAINEVRIGGNRETSELDVIDVMGLNGMTSLATFDAAGARAQIAGLPWVAEATVRKNYPDTVQVDIRERNGYAVWQHGEHLTVIDSAGLPIDDYAPARDSTLPLVTGRGAPERVREAMGLVGAFPTIARQTKGFIRVGERRWDVRLRNGITIKLPEDGAGEALEALVSIDNSQNLLARDITEVDMRLSDRIVVRLGENAVEARAQAVKDRDAALKKQLKEAHI